MTNQAPESTPDPIWSPEQGLRLAKPVGPEAVLDPALNQDLDTAFLIRQIFRGLVSLAPALTPVPELAESIEVLDAGARFRFRLRSQATFHNGMPILAEQVKQSLTRALSPALVGVTDASALAGARFLYDIVGAEALLTGNAAELEGVVLVDPQMIDIKLIAPSATFLMRLASESALIVDVDQTGQPDWWLRPNGSGPFVVQAFEPGIKLTLQPFDQWWAERPKASHLDIRLGNEASQPINLYQAGEIDLVEGVPAGQALLLKDPATGFDIGEEVVTPLFAFAYLAFDNHLPPLDDPHVRRALRLVFPAEQFVQGRLNGAVVAATSIVPDGMLGTIWWENLVVGDPEAARQELALSRYESGSQVPPITIHAADASMANALAEVAATELGITINVIHVDWPDFLAGLEAKLFPAYGLYWGADYPDPESLLAMLFATDSSSNFTGYSNPPVDRLLSEAAAEQDFATRISLYREAQRKLLDDGAVIPVYFDRVHAFFRRGLGGLSMTPMGLQGLERVG